MDGVVGVAVVCPGDGVFLSEWEGLPVLLSEREELWRLLIELAGLGRPRFVNKLS